MEYEKIVELIPKGKENAIHQKKLAKLTGVTPARIKSLVRIARRDNIPICSCYDGYYLPKNKQELDDFIKKHEKTARSYFVTLKELKASQKQIDGQMSIDEVADDGKRKKTDMV